MSKTDNPTVFPTFEGENVFTMGGMTLRDYFAGQALALLAGDDTAHDLGDRVVAKWCYSLADAMLEARKKGGEA